MAYEIPVDIEEKVEKLERAVLELGTEIYNMKGSLSESQDSQEQMLATFNGLKKLLDEKGVIHQDDFDAAIELGEAIEQFNSLQEHSAFNEIEKLKKSSH